MVDVGKREDALLDKISELTLKRDATLRQIQLWRETQPELSVVLDDVEINLR